LTWNITNACNLKCKQCYQDAGPSKDELTLKEKFKIIDHIADTGIIFLNFAGGEPLLSKNFLDVAEYASRRGMYVRVLTNGTLLSKKVADRLSSMGVDMVIVSLDGAINVTNDKIRGVPGCYEKAVRGIKNCVDKKIKTAIAMTLSKYNYKEIDALVRLAKRLGVKYFFVKPFIPTGRGCKFSFMDLSPEVKNYVVKKLAGMSIEEKDLIISVDVPQYECALCDMPDSDGKIKITDFGVVMETDVGIKLIESGCRAGTISIILNPNGDIKPCMYMDIVIGNVKKDSIKNVWENSEVIKNLRTREDLKGNCGKCKDKYICGGCRALAYAYFKDLKAPDPGCIKNLDLWNKIKNKHSKV
jgi:radical SAM protein with 4Fe4S-binding SPASM domain